MFFLVRQKVSNGISPDSPILSGTGCTLLSVDVRGNSDDSRMEISTVGLGLLRVETTGISTVGLGLLRVETLKDRRAKRSNINCIIIKISKSINTTRYDTANGLKPRRFVKIQKTQKSSKMKILTNE